MKKNIYADNGGGLTLQIGRFIHHYCDPKQCAEDIICFWRVGHTENWEGNEYDQLKNGEYDNETKSFRLDNPLFIRLLLESNGRAAQELGIRLLGEIAVDNIVYSQNL